MHETALQLLLPLFDAPTLPRTRSDGRRLLQMNDQSIEYQLQRSRRRTIGFAIDERGLTVTAPRWVTLADIENSLLERGEWIVRKMIEWSDYLARRERSATRWEDGATLQVLGETLTMHLTQPASLQASISAGLPPQIHPLQSPRRVKLSPVQAVARVGSQLFITLPYGGGSDHMKLIVHGWLQQHAREVFEPRMRHFASRLGRQPRRWALSSARTRWGSCAPDGSIRLNYIIAHEIAHLREMNHGPRFWATVADLLPGYEPARDWLRHVPT
jgi:predicted metal-dependent hydrolase